jgi:hypothetical protein
VTPYEGGDTITVRACNLLPGSEATIDLGGTVLGSSTVDDDGCIHALVTLPTDIVDGTHLVIVIGTDLGGEATTIESEIEVLAQTILNIIAGPLPFTGAELGTTLSFAFLLLFGGAVVLGLARFDRRLARRFG